MTQGQRSLSANFRPFLRQLLWHEIGIISLIVMEFAWVMPWFRSISPSIEANAGPSSFFVLLAFFLIVTYANRILRSMDMQDTTHRLILIGMLLIGLYALSGLLVYPGLGLGFGEIINRTLLSLQNVFKDIPEGFLVILMGIYLWWRGISLSSGILEIRATERKFRFGILMLGIFGLVFRGAQISYLIDILPLYFGAGLLAVTFSRTATLGRGVTAFRLPYTSSWFIGMVIITLLTIILGIFSSQFLQSDVANSIFGLLNHLFNFLQIILYPVIQVFIFILEKLFEFFTRIVDIDSIGNTLNQIPEMPTPELPFEQGESTLIIPPIVKILIVLLLLAGLVIVIVRRTNRAYRYKLPSFEDAGETVFEPEQVRSRLERFISQLRERFDLIRTFGLGRRMLAATVIRRIYTQLLHLAQDIGLPRHVSETPYEFQVRLGEVFREQSEHIELITDAYVHVRYGEIPEEEKIITLVEDAWDAIEKEGRRLGRGNRA
jgi:hypothetical protein